MAQIDTNQASISAGMSDYRKNTPQLKTIGIASIIFITGGMNIAWSTGFSSGLIFSEGLAYCWFIGAIFGALIAAFLINKLRMKLFLLASSTLVTLGGIIYTVSPTDAATVTAARTLNGLAFGWIYIPAIIVGGEQAIKLYRGRFLSLEAFSVSCGIFIQIIFLSDYTNTDNLNVGLIHGIIVIILGIIALILSYLYALESPVILLLRGEENAALECLTNLQRPIGLVTHETHALLEEHKCLIAEHSMKTQSEILSESFMGFFKMCLYRCFVAMSFTLPLHTALVVATIVGPGVIWPLTIYASLRWVGSIVYWFIADLAGRKKPLLLGLLASACLLIFVGVTFNRDLYSFTIEQMYTSIYLLAFYQFFAGFYAGPSGPYMSEAFPLQFKSWFIAAVFVVEMLIHIIITVTSINAVPLKVAIYCFVLIGLTFVFVVFVFLFMPETKHTTLREAQAKFRQLLNIGFN